MPTSEALAWLAMMDQDRPGAAPQLQKHGHERLTLVIALVVMACGFFLLAGAFANDAAKSTPKLIEAYNAGRWANVKDYAYAGTYWCAVVNGAGFLMLAAATPLWHRRWSSHPGPIRQKISSPWPFRLGLLACVLVAGALRFTTATGGFWHDEGLQMKRVSGSFVDTAEADGVAGFREAPWTDTWFHFRKPTNHTIIGVPARVCLECWRALSGAARADFAEWVVRLPTIAAGLASIVLLGLLGQRIHSPTAGLLAALLLAIHPWHVRWGVDARSYGIGMFAVCLAFTGLIRAIDTGRWRWWLVFGLGQWLLLWASLMHLWLAAALFLAAVVMVWRNLQQHPRPPQWGRLLFANTLAAALFFQTMGPNLIQFIHAGKVRNPAAEEFMKLDDTTAMDFASNLLLGLPHAVPIWENDIPITTWTSLFATTPVAGYALLATALLLALGGVMVLWKFYRPASVVLVAVIVAGAVHLILTKCLDWYYYPRFSTYLLPPVVLAWAVAWAALAKTATRHNPGMASPLAVAAALAFFLPPALPQLSNLSRHGHEPFPQLRAAFVAQRAAAPANKALTACYGLGGDIMADIYDPRCRFIHTAAEIDSLITTARQTNQPLVIGYGLQSFNRPSIPDGFRLLDDPRLFAPLQRFAGNDPRHTFFLFTLKEGISYPLPPSGK